MPSLDLFHTTAAIGAAFIAGAINAVAGGGTLITFPVLMWLGLPSVGANATNTVAVWPATLGGMWGFRQEMREAQTRYYAFVVPSLVGGILGAFLLRLTPASVFDHMVPFLILFATLLFVAQETVQRKLKFAGEEANRSQAWFWGASFFQLLVGLYGGYFGAGMGIMMLAALSLLGLTDLYQMNGLKNLFGTCINGIAAVYFIGAKMVYWPFALLMMIGSTAGGYLCAGLARRLGRQAVRRIVIAIGFGLSISLFLKMK